MRTLSSAADQDHFSIAIQGLGKFVVEVRRRNVGGRSLHRLELEAATIDQVEGKKCPHDGGQCPDHDDFPRVFQEYNGQGV
eukprot:CAMPEP_0206614486 /NCGR_PEP_ID=MMETSP0325_2-20121206/57432_1 /ASSEMBLY_ACC=CAM_ASM_000347 /TAXON_ID=2866 /ORGANISM="Crypthecodinium cohnii, Strain Seligo" /LENGTH=80 /DNA_ID=CAMNT_0054135015 /DNA_START=260 /DNA_END=502 /DNA_ORIENTATION=+